MYTSLKNIDEHKNPKENEKKKNECEGNKNEEHKQK